MGTRIELGQKLRQILGSDNVYFQPPETVKLKYDCIIYELSDTNVGRADDTAYKRMRGYKVTRIGRGPDEHLIDAFLDSFPYCRYDRRFVTDNLYHDVFMLYY